MTLGRRKVPLSTFLLNRIGLGVSFLCWEDELLLICATLLVALFAASVAVAAPTVKSCPYRSPEKFQCSDN